jgi:hypothetical protein
MIVYLHHQVGPFLQVSSQTIPKPAWRLTERPAAHRTCGHEAGVAERRITRLGRFLIEAAAGMTGVEIEQ